MDKKTKFLALITLALVADNVRVGLMNIKLKKFVAMQTNRADTFQELFTVTADHVPDDLVEPLKAKTSFILVTHGFVPPE